MLPVSGLAIGRYWLNFGLGVRAGGSQIWFDWDTLRQVSNKRFIQDDGTNPNILSLRSFAKDERNYFSFKTGYIPNYSNIERHFLKLPNLSKDPVPAVGMTFQTFIE